MKKIIIVFVLFFLLACKKTKLEGDYGQLIGTWQWFGGYLDYGNPNYRIEFKERGKYKLYHGTVKIDYGRLVQNSNRLKLISDKPFRWGPYNNGEYFVVYLNNDTLSIGNDHTPDHHSSSFTKKH